MRIIKAIIIIAIIAVAFMLCNIWSTKTTNSVFTPFDHSQCQYPNRLSNPPDGCDNSDPARPECMKYGTEDCNIPMETIKPTNYCICE